jgi:hypothetical protein
MQNASFLQVFTRELRANCVQVHVTSRIQKIRLWPSAFFFIVAEGG